MLRQLLNLLFLLGVNVVESQISTNTQRHYRCIESEGGSFVIPTVVSDHIFDLAQLIDLTTVSGVSDNHNPGFDTFRVFEDCDDLAIVASRGGSCYAVFRATVFINPLDMIQLFDWRKEMIGSCTVRRGFSNAFYSSYYGQFMAELDDCMSGNSELIIGGHSQGGAISVVASVALAHYNPTTITFGAVRSLVGHCPDIDPNRHYRFINAVESSYDQWPMRFSKGAAHVGHTILLDPAASNPAAYVGMNDDTDRFPNSRRAHKTHFSFDALSKLYNNVACPDVEIGGWEDGHMCYADDECNGSCVKSRCVSS